MTFIAKFLLKYSVFSITHYEIRMKFYTYNKNMRKTFTPKQCSVLRNTYIINISSVFLLGEMGKINKGRRGTGGKNTHPVHFCWHIKYNSPHSPLQITWRKFYILLRKLTLVINYKNVSDWIFECYKKRKLQ